MDHILHLAQTLASFGLVLGVLVSIHEMGHYIAARCCGITVEAFSLGFGPALKTWVDKRNTEWKISILPLGGYVKMYGMNPEAEAEAIEAGVPFRHDEAYTQKKVWQRAVVAAAGPAANFLLAIVLFTLLLGFNGRMVPLAVVGEVIPHSAAAAAGLQKGDSVTAVNGTKITLFDDLRKVVVASPGHDLTMQVHRGNADLTLTAHIAASDAPNGGILGVRPGAEKTESVSPLAALIGGVQDTWTVLTETFTGLIQIVTGKASSDELGGPIAIAHMSGQMAQLGVATLLTFIAMLSVNLGLVNLLPIPILDGGHLMFYAAEALRGRPVPVRAQEYGYRVGMAIIASIFVFASFNDLAKEGVFRWVARLIG